jgi:uncharacterized protein YlxP (DUF503 family)
LSAIPVGLPARELQIPTLTRVALALLAMRLCELKATVYVCAILEFAMPVGLLLLELQIPDAHSLKDKRQIIRSLKDRLRRKFNIAIAELDFHDVWQSSTIGIVTLSNAEQHVEESLQSVLREAQRILGPILVDHSVDIL